MARREIVIVCPYIKLWGHFQHALATARQNGASLRLFYREDEDAKMDLPALRGLFHQLVPVKFLHAKIYCFDDEVLISSMNAYDFSNSNSREIAVRLTDDAQRHEVRQWIQHRLLPINTAPVISAASIATPAKPSAPKKLSEKGEHARAGFLQGVAAVANVVRNVAEAMRPQPGSCIRCAQAIPFDPDKPFCGDCYKQWNRYKNPEYEEKFCHDCGKKARTSLLKPVCYACYKAAKA